MANSRSLFAVIWEWETNDNGVFVPYDELSSNLIETDFAAGKQLVNLSQLGPNYSAWTVDLSAMQQHSKYFGRKRNIQRTTYSTNLPIAYGVVWEFLSDLDWQQFDVRTSAIIEQNYSNGETTLAMEEVNDSPVVIDFSSMVVRNNQTMSLKRVKRRVLQVPYIGGSVGPLSTSNLPHQMGLRNRKKQTRKKRLSSKNDGKIIVWESEIDFPGVFAPYSERNSNLIEQQYAAGMRKVSVSLNASSVLQVNFTSMKAMQNRFGRECAIRRVLYPKDVPIASKISWEWMGDLDWNAYQVETSVLIEDHYQKGDSTLDMRRTPLNIPNTLSFTRMNQKNQFFGTERQVRRRIMSTGYIEERSAGRKSATLAAQRLSGTNTFGADETVRAPEYYESQFDVTGFDQKSAETVVDEVLDDEEGEKEDEDGEEDEIEANKPKTLPKTYRLVKVPISHPILKQFCDSCDSVEEDDECSICLSELRHPSETYGATSKNSVVELKQCHHKFHECCIVQCYENGNKDGSMQCPVCKSIHGTKRGNQPPGTMTVQRIPGTVPGYSGSGCIQITYNIQSGVQGREHPNPGQPYHANGFPRVAYLPDNPKGNKVLQLLQEAWNRKLIFTVGTSVTSGMQNAVVWNEIHHKTEAFSNSSGHGYPDPNYLDNVLSELKVQGVE